MIPEPESLPGARSVALEVDAVPTEVVPWTT